MVNATPQFQGISLLENEPSFVEFKDLSPMWVHPDMSSLSTAVQGKPRSRASAVISFYIFSFWMRYLPTYLPSLRAGTTIQSVWGS
jgi:hypothetical protein